MQLIIQTPVEVAAVTGRKLTVMVSILFHASFVNLFVRITLNAIA